ncbi:urease accessory protein UreE [Hyphomicrobium sp. CS1GBMeth3]|uniref:urease accessory protein UreE n=1 Tax=Hyphomicrobium sp. CS1GBMeth3 TaxID=1892845 RepID=UPI00093122F9|nr:urease accessory protein UreE [Hyphomicrobium sp. CS1GBMeth3]
MIRAVRREPQGARHGLIEDEVTLGFDGRFRRRIALTGAKGLQFLLDLPQVERLRNGDALVLEDGRRVRVIAAPEPLAEITAPSADALVRIAWHLGNRHLPVMLAEERILIRRDHVIEDMVRGLGATVAHVDAPFDPESGAYADGAHGHHHHHHHEDHDHQRA